MQDDRPPLVCLQLREPPPRLLPRPDPQRRIRRLPDQHLGQRERLDLDRAPFVQPPAPSLQGQGQPRHRWRAALRIVVGEERRKGLLQGVGRIGLAPRVVPGPAIRWAPRSEKSSLASRSTDRRRVAELAEQLRQECGEGRPTVGCGTSTPFHSWGNLEIAYSVRVGEDATRPVHAVSVRLRREGLYLFEDRIDAEAFVKAVDRYGGQAEPAELVHELSHALVRIEVPIFDASQVAPLPEFPGGPAPLEPPHEPIGGDGLAAEGRKKVRGSFSGTAPSARRRSTCFLTADRARPDTGAAVPYVAGWAERAEGDPIEAYAELIDRLARRSEAVVCE
jgi:hypothetical protein